MESIASEAGVARATVYRRFKDKADLITAAIADNPGGRFPDEPSDDPRADLVVYLEAFDERFGESCVEVIGTLLGSREERDALALHRQRVVEPRTALRPQPCSCGPRSSGSCRPTPMSTWPCRCSRARSWPDASAALRAHRTGRRVPST